MNGLLVTSGYSSASKAVHIPFGGRRTSSQRRRLRKRPLREIPRRRAASSTRPWFRSAYSETLQAVCPRCDGSRVEPEQNVNPDSGRQWYRSLTFDHRWSLSSKYGLIMPILSCPTWGAATPRLVEAPSEFWVGELLPMRRVWACLDDCERRLPGGRCRRLRRPRCQKFNSDVFGARRATLAVYFGQEFIV